jgi:serine/threonine-protein kinase HipA
MAKAGVYFNGELAGYLEKIATDAYRFTYEEKYLADEAMPSISLTLPKTQQVHESKVLFSFFAGMLAEGINKDIQCRLLKIDPNDDFTRLMKTAMKETIGAITVKEITE